MHHCEAMPATTIVDIPGATTTTRVVVVSATRGVKVVAWDIVIPTYRCYASSKVVRKNSG